MTTDRNPMTFARRATFSNTTKAALVLVAAVLAAASASAQTRSPGGSFERLDTNGDGIVDSAELESMRREMFRRADEDGDGFLTEREIDRLVDDRGDMLRARRGGPAGRLGGGGARRRMADAGGAFGRLDADGDGRISEAEFVQAENPMLERLDSNRDGAITRSEFEQAQQRIRQQAQRRRAL